VEVKGMFRFGKKLVGDPMRARYSVIRGGRQRAGRRPTPEEVMARGAQLWSKQILAEGRKIEKQNAGICRLTDASEGIVIILVPSGESPETWLGNKMMLNTSVSSNFEIKFRNLSELVIIA